MEYFGHTVHFNAYADDWAPSLRSSPYFELMGFAWWSAFRVLGYFVVPALVVVLVFKERIRDHGLETKGFFEHAWIYAISYVVVLVCVILVARHDAHFQTYYPFYGHASRSWADFWMWELLYAAQFFSLEFFFRGFWLRSMKPSLGSYAIFAMVVPYCMIHFGKPFLETMAAIIAGIVLGTLSMKTRSIWSGFLIHVSVAISMDMAALLATDGLPTQTWP
jgi:membrane protease YdiL (CAAX protease family)